MTEIQITAVGDLMVKRYIISDAKDALNTSVSDLRTGRRDLLNRMLKHTTAILNRE